MDRTAVIEFEDYPDEWVRVRLSGVSMATYEAVIDAVNGAAARFLPDQLRALREAIVPALVDWSFAEPADADGLLARDPNWLLALCREWLQGVREVPLPLPRRSSAIAQSEDPSPSDSDEPNSMTTS